LKDATLARVQNQAHNDSQSKCSQWA